MVERRTVAPDVAGSIPVTHPNPHSPSAHRAVAFSSRAVLWALLVVWLVAGCGVDTAAERVQPERAVRTPAGTGGTNHPSVVSEPHVVLVSFDGFRADYLDRFDTPNFDRLAARGIRADGLTSVFPSLTFPAHYSISTGLYPESHGIVGNRFFDPERDDEFNYRDRDDAQDGSWWGGEPIWVTAETQGMVAAAFFFPGTEAAIAGVRPSHWQPYDGRVANTDRVDQVVEWLSLPPERRPHFVALYFSLVDGAGQPDRPRCARHAAKRRVSRPAPGSFDRPCRRPAAR